jgi:hypothetical protein
LKDGKATTEGEGTEDNVVDGEVDTKDCRAGVVVKEDC